MSKILASYELIDNGRLGEILYGTDGAPAAVLVGSCASNGRKPWNIRGRKVWLAVGCASRRGAGITWCTSNAYMGTTCVESIAGMTYSANSSSSGPHHFWMYDSDCTEAFETEIDSAFNDVGTSDELTAKILSFNANMKAAKWCNDIVLDDGTRMDLPSIDVLARIYLARHIVDSVDPTLVDYPSYSLENNWGFDGDDNEIFTACVYSSINPYVVMRRNDTTGDVHSTVNKWMARGVLPILEIPA